MKRDMKELLAGRPTARVMSALAATALVLAGQTRSFAQFVRGPGADGYVYMLESTLLDSSGNAYVLDDPDWGGPGTQVNLWQINNGSNQLWYIDNIAAGRGPNYYTIQAYWANSSSQPLCLDCKNSGTDPGTVVQVWYCNGTWAQNWAIQTSGMNQGFVIVPGNAYWMALTPPGASNGALLTLENQSYNTNDYWNVMAAQEADMGTSDARWCYDNQTGCTILILGPPVAGGVYQVPNLLYSLTEAAQSLYNWWFGLASNTAKQAGQTVRTISTPVGMGIVNSTGEDVIGTDGAAEGTGSAVDAAVQASDAALEGSVGAAASKLGVNAGELAGEAVEIVEVFDH